MVWWLLLLLALIFLRVPVAFALLATSAAYFIMGPGSDAVLLQRMTSGLESFPLLAVPFFVLAGTAMARGGIAERLISFAEVLVGHHRGGLAQVNVLNSLMVGGMSGSANADAAIDSKVLVPVMRRRGYSNGFASALSAASGVLAPVLPPSIGLILYGVLAGVSIGDLFIAGIVPALLLAGSLMVVVRYISGRRGYLPTRERRAGLPEVLRTGWHALFALLMPVLLIVGLRIGVFTPTELGALAAVYALVVGIFIYKELSWRDIGAVLRESVLTTSVIILIVAGASAFGLLVSYERLPVRLVDALAVITSNPWIVLLLLNVLLLILGTVMESLSLMVILTPVLAPVAAEVGIDPLHFGVVLVVNLTVGSITPPVGTVVYTVCSITECSLGDFTKEFLPLFGAIVAVLFLITFVPALVTTLPAWFG